MDGIAYLSAAAAEEDPEIDDGVGPLFVGDYDDYDRIKKEFDDQYYSFSGHSSSSSESSSSPSSFPEQLPLPRVWELTSNSTRYDTLRAAPSDNTRIIMWSIWSVIACLVSMIIIIVFYGILKSILRKRNSKGKLPTTLARRSPQQQQQQQEEPQHATITRRANTATKTNINPFNIYLLFSMFPDLLLVSMFGISCIINAVLTSTTSCGDGCTGFLLRFQQFTCYFQSCYVVFCVSCTTWITSIIAYQLHSMLRSTFIRKQNTIPTTKQVIYQSLLVYMCSALLATFGVISTNLGHGDDGQGDSNWWYHILYETTSLHGLICVPVPNYDDTYNTIFFYSIFLPLLCGIPILYCTYVCYDVIVHRKHILLPNNATSSTINTNSSSMKRLRLFTVYLYRIVGSIVIMWIPAITLLWIVGGIISSPWASWFGGTWMLLQGGVSAVLSLLKQDLRDAVQESIPCQPIRNCISLLEGILARTSNKTNRTNNATSPAAAAGNVNKQNRNVDCDQDDDQKSEEQDDDVSSQDSHWIDGACFDGIIMGDSHKDDSAMDITGFPSTSGGGLEDGEQTQDCGEASTNAKQERDVENLSSTSNNTESIGTLENV